MSVPTKPWSGVYVSVPVDGLKLVTVPCAGCVSSEYVRVDVVPAGLPFTPLNWTGVAVFSATVGAESFA